MKRTKITIDNEYIPKEFSSLLSGGDTYDSSCSPEARVIYIDKDCGYFLKTAEKGTLKKEAELDNYFHKKGLGARVVGYASGERDWLLTERVPGEDATSAIYLEDPKRLAIKSGEILRALHEIDFSDCPIQNRMEGYFALADENYAKGAYDLSFCSLPSAEDAYRLICSGRALMKNEVLLHGDYCLPNFLMNNWKFTGFIDLGNAGVGDRHVDLFWGAWTLNFNLKTDKFRNIFFDAYGRELVDKDKLSIIAAAEVFG